MYLTQFFDEEQFQVIGCVTGKICIIVIVISVAFCSRSHQPSILFFLFSYVVFLKNRKSGLETIPYTIDPHPGPHKPWALKIKGQFIHLARFLEISIPLSIEMTARSGLLCPRPVMEIG